MLWSCLAPLALFAWLGACTLTEPDPMAALGTSTASAPLPAATPGGDEPVRIKGLGPHLLLHRKRDGHIEELRDGDVAQAGDLVQVSYMAAGNRNGVVLSLDGRGLVTLHHPARPDARATLVARGQHALDHAYELDDAHSYERFVLVTSGDELLPPATVITAARRLAQAGPAARHSPLPLPERWQQTSLLIHKRP